MVFVTVGTHEQQFNRLVSYMDEWASSHDEEVVIQSGFSTYEPQSAKFSKLYPYKTMVELVDKARIVITHGGPSSFIMPLQIGKVPVVVPRMKDFDEHVNNHQLDFARAVAERQGNIIVVEDVTKLADTIDNYESIVTGMKNGLNSNNEVFCNRFENLVDEMMKGKK